MNVITGNNAKAYLDTVLVFCGKSLTFTETKDKIESTPTGSGIWTYNRLQKRGWQVDISGLTKHNSSDGQLDYFSVIASPQAFHALVLTFEDDLGNINTISGTVLKPKTQITGPASAFDLASVTLLGTGPYILTISGGSSSSSGGSGGASSGGGACVPINNVGGFNPPNALLYTDWAGYTYSGLTGTPPYSLDGASVPSFMDVNLVGNDVVLSQNRQPNNTDLSDGFPIQIFLSNACGSTELDVTMIIHDTGQNVFVLNQTGDDLSLANSHLTIYTYPAGTNGNIQLPSASVNIVAMTGTHDVAAYQSFPGTPDDTFTGQVAGNIITAFSNFANLNYLQFQA